MNITRFTSQILLAALVWTAGCIPFVHHSDPLAGWKVLFSQDSNKLDKAIRDDYQDYIQKMSPKQRNHVGPIQLFEDGTGQHAVKFEVFENNTNASWQHVLIYDKENKRIKVIKYGYTRYMS